MGGERYTVGKVTALAIQRAIKLPKRRKIFLFARTAMTEADGRSAQEVPSGRSHRSLNWLAGARRCLSSLHTAISDNSAPARHSSQLDVCRHRRRLSELDDMTSPTVNFQDCISDASQRHRRCLLTSILERLARCALAEPAYHGSWKDPVYVSRVCRKALGS